jgi:hypothetical protein
MQAIPETGGMQQAADDHLRLGVTATDARHE